MLRVAKEGVGALSKNRPLLAQTFPQCVYRMMGTSTTSTPTVRVTLPAVIPEQTPLPMVRQQPPTTVKPWVPFNSVQAATHTAKFSDKGPMQEELNAAESSALVEFQKLAHKSDKTLKVLVGGEATHPRTGTLEDLIERMNFWKEKARSYRGPFIFQTSANYYEVLPDTYVNCSIIVDFVRGRTHLLIKGSVATEIDRYGQQPEKMLKVGPRVTQFGGLSIGHGICLDAFALADMLNGVPGSYKLALMSSYGDPSSSAPFLKNTLKFVQDHRSVQESGASGSRATTVGRAPRSFLDELFLLLAATEAEGRSKDHQAQQRLDVVTRKEESLVVAGSQGSVVKPVSRSLASQILMSQLNVYNPMMLELIETHPAPPDAWKLWLAWMKKKSGL